MRQASACTGAPILNVPAMLHSTSMRPNRSTRALRNAGGVGRSCEIGGHEQRARGLGTEALGQSLAVAIDQHDVGVAVGERTRDRPPEIAGCTGDDDGLVAEVHGFRVRSGVRRSYKPLRPRLASDLPLPRPVNTAPIVTIILLSSRMAGESGADSISQPPCKRKSATASPQGCVGRSFAEPVRVQRAGFRASRALLSRVRPRRAPRRRPPRPPHARQRALLGERARRTAQPKRLQYLSLSAYADDFDALAARLRARGAMRAAPAVGRTRRLGPRRRRHADPESSQAPKVIAVAKDDPRRRRTRAGRNGAAPSRKTARPVRPRRLSHVLAVHARRIAPGRVLHRDVRLATVGSIGRHHRVHARPARERSPHARFREIGRAPDCIIRAGTSASLDDVGLGAELMKDAGLPRRAGASAGTCSARTISTTSRIRGEAGPSIRSTSISSPPTSTGRPRDHPPEDSFYIWGPTVPDDFVINHEQPRSRVRRA